MQRHSQPGRPEDADRISHLTADLEPEHTDEGTPLVQPGQRGAPPSQRFDRGGLKRTIVAGVVFTVLTAALVIILFGLLSP